MQYHTKKLSRLCAMVGIAIGGMHVGTAKASCYVYAGTVYTIGQGTPIVVRGDEAADTVIVTSEAPNDGVKWRVPCTVGEYDFISKITGQTGDTFPVQVNGIDAGVGLRIIVTEEAGNYGDGDPHTFPWTVKRNVTAQGDISISDTVQYELVKRSGPVRYGKADVATVAYSSVTGSANAFRTIKTNDLILARPSCSISASSLTQTVALGDHSSSMLGKPGDATPWIPFQLISENCDSPSGIIADITFGTSSDADAQNVKLFKVTPGKVRGVGIELARSTTGSEEVLPGKTISLSAVSTGAAYSFKARMQRTSAALVPGNFSKGIVVQVDFR